jgi:acetyl-CoA carboxylase alpha subunit
MFDLTVPVLSLVIGEGGSGGALALGIGDQVLMQEFSVYSVISPESCASILWNDSSLAERAAEKLKMSPNELHRMGVIDGIIPEPKGGAHRDWTGTFALTRENLLKRFGPILASFFQGDPRTAGVAGVHAQESPALSGHKKTSAKAAAKGTKSSTKKQLSETAETAPMTGKELRLKRHEKFRTLGNFAIAHASNGNGGAS